MLTGTVCTRLLRLCVCAFVCVMLYDVHEDGASSIYTCVYVKMQGCWRKTRWRDQHVLSECVLIRVCICEHVSLNVCADIGSEDQGETYNFKTKKRVVC